MINHGPRCMVAGCRNPARKKGLGPGHFAKFHPTPSMICPNCGGHELLVKDSRPYSGTVKRRRECASCHTRFITLEIIGEELPAAVDYTKAISAVESVLDLLRHLSKPTEPAKDGVPPNSNLDTV